MIEINNNQQDCQRFIDAPHFQRVVGIINPVYPDLLQTADLSGMLSGEQRITPAINDTAPALSDIRDAVCSGRQEQLRDLLSLPVADATFPAMTVPMLLLTNSVCSYSGSESSATLHSSATLSISSRLKAVRATW